MGGDSPPIRSTASPMEDRMRMPIVRVGGTWSLSRLGGLLLALALFTGSAAHIAFAQRAATTIRTEKSVEDLALQWFERMRTGQIDRAQLAPAYSAQLTDDAVQGMAQYFKHYDYGVPPSSAKLLQTRTIGDQTFYLVKLIFPRGDATTLMFGFNDADKITGITLMGLAGD
jgi:hypothetical protein